MESYDSLADVIKQLNVEKAERSCSCPHLVKLLEEGKIQYTKVGKHRRIVFEDVVEYKKSKWKFILYEFFLRMDGFLASLWI